MHDKTCMHEKISPDIIILHRKRKSFFGLSFISKSFSANAENTKNDFETYSLPFTIVIV